MLQIIVNLNLLVIFFDKKFTCKYHYYLFNITVREEMKKSIKP
jgi:regulatory protein YycI of two-component signal transduction system YycFG